MKKRRYAIDFSEQAMKTYGSISNKESMNKMGKLLAVLVMTFGVITYAQDKCECSKVLEQLIIKVETGYPGFRDKVKDPIAYASFKKQLLESSRGSSTDDCINILKQYTSYFKDAHLVINKKEVETIIPQLNSPDAVDININEFNKHLRKSKDGVEGVWTSGDYKVGVKKHDNTYIAFVISSKNELWKPSEIKFKLDDSGKATYYWGDHTQSLDTFAILKGCIIYFKEANVAFVKEFPAPPLSKESISEAVNELEGFYLKPISDKTILLRISSFAGAYTERIKKLLESNKLLLDKYEYLIIDVRGNGGGTDYSFHPIRPYLYTNPMRQLSGEYLVTQTLINNLEKWADGADKVKEADDIKFVRNQIQRMEGKIGEFVPYSENEIYGFTKLDSMLPFPKNVAILVDKGCGSSTEKFLLDAKQSKKVKILGTPTYGVIDYNNVYEFSLDCKKYALFMPTVRMMRLPEYQIDNIGIQPDIYMDKYIKDWVQYAKEYLENE